MKVQWFKVHSKAKSRLSLTHLYQYNRWAQNIVRPMSRPRPESVRTRPRPRPRPKYCYETKNYKTETETETSLVDSVAYGSKTNRYAHVIDYI